MYLDAVWSYQALSPGMLAGKAAVVIDVLRATSTMVTALAGGCRGVLPELNLQAARERASRLVSGSYLLGGEERALRPPDFDLGNSPLDYRPSLVAGKYLILATSNGTRALRATIGAAEVMVGCFMNAGAVAEALKASGRNGLLVCAGQGGVFSPEDAACAGMIADRLLGYPGIEASPSVDEARRLYLAHRSRLPAFMRHTLGGANLIRLGLGADLEFCARADAFPLVPRYRKGLVF